MKQIPPAFSWKGAAFPDTLVLTNFSYVSIFMNTDDQTLTHGSR